MYQFLSVCHGEIRVKGIKCILYLRKEREGNSVVEREGAKNTHFLLQLTAGSETLWHAKAFKTDNTR